MICKSEHADVISLLSSPLLSSLLPSPLLSTVPLPPPLSVHIPMVSHSSLRVSWVPGAVDVPGHRIVCASNHGSDAHQVTSCESRQAGRKCPIYTLGCY